MEDQNNLLMQLHDTLDDQDTFLVKLPHKFKDDLTDPEVFDNITGTMQITEKKKN